MGCNNTKIPVQRTDRERVPKGLGKKARKERKARKHAGLSPVPFIADGRKSVAFNVSVDGRKVESLIMSHPPKKSQKFEPAKDSKINVEDLMKKQKKADAKREQALRKKRLAAHKSSQRGEMANQIKEQQTLAHVQHTAKQIEIKDVTTEELKSAKQREFTERQRQRELKAMAVRQQKSEPLNENKLSADIILHSENREDGKTQEEVDKTRLALIDKYRQRRLELEAKTEIDEEETRRRIEVQMHNSARIRETKQREKIEWQRQREERAKQVRNKKMTTTVGQSLSTDNSFYQNTDVEIWDETPLKPSICSAEMLPVKKWVPIPAEEHQVDVSDQMAGEDLKWAEQQRNAQWSVLQDRLRLQEEGIERKPPQRLAPLPPIPPRNTETKRSLGQMIKSIGQSQKTPTGKQLTWRDVLIKQNICYQVAKERLGVDNLSLLSVGEPFKWEKDQNEHTISRIKDSCHRELSPQYEHHEAITWAKDKARSMREYNASEGEAYGP